MLPALAAALSILLQAAPAPPSSHPAVASYVPQRVYDTARKAFTDFEMMAADLSRADVVLVGEEHFDPNTHKLEAALLAALTRRNVPVTVSLEMFERDVQGLLDDYLRGAVTEPSFLAGSRPWKNYETDYRPLVEMARAFKWPVLASNVPRRIAQEVARGGEAALARTPEADKALYARELQCPRDTYFDRFAGTMSAHPVPGQDAKAAEETTVRYYWAQCVKDETMAESIAAVFAANGVRPGVVVHYNGAFHSDFQMGAAERVRRRLPGRRVVTLTIVPVTDIDAAAPASPDLTRADYIVYTTK